MDKIVGIYLICVFTFSLPVYTTQADVLYPFGADEGDTVLPKEDDGGTLVDIDVDFPFFDQNHRSLFINTNGIISFLENVLEYTPESFPLGDNRRVIAPFWADVDTSSADGGEIWYRQINNVTQLQDATDEIMRVFAVDFAFQPFVAKWALIVTWHNVTFYDKHDIAFKNQPKNTFQAVLLTDEVYSFTIFNYGVIEWTTGASSGGDKHTGLADDDDAIAAQVGFNAGDNKNYYSVPNSRTNAIQHITDTTNVGRPGSEGRWVFRIDNKEIVAAGCEDDSDSALQIYPEQVSMLGGDVLSISGPCFDSYSDVYCRMDGHVIQATYDFARDPFTVRCPTPIFMKLGSVAVEISKDGGTLFTYTGYTTAVGLERQTPRVTIADISNDVLEVTINPNNFPDQTSIPESTRIDVFIYSYKENKDTGEVVLKPEAVIKESFRLSQTRFLDNKTPLDSVDVALFRVVEAGMVDLNSEDRWLNGERVSTANVQPIPSIWSMPYNANPDDSKTNAHEWCEAWAEQESVLNVKSDNVAPCPCTLPQAMADIGRFEPDPWCNMAMRGEDGNCRYRTSAKHCVRARMASNEGRGQLCCYANDDNLLILKDVPEGGFVQSNHHGGFTPVRHPGTIPFLSNFLNDRVPWEQCCPRTSDRESCDLFSERRPSDDCKAYEPPKAATVFGDPHFVSFDGSGYTFNGFGEFTLVTANNPEVTLQARMAETMKDVFATGVIAMTMQSAGSDVVQVELSERRVMDTWVKRGNGQTWSRLAFYQFPYWDAQGVTIEQLASGTEVAVLVTFDTGLAVTVTVPKNANAMSVIVVAPPSVKDKTRGLLGTWNGDTSEDIQTPTGELIDREDPHTLHYQYGVTWVVTEPESLFRYDIGVNHTTVNNLEYVPVLSLTSTVPEDTLQEVCGDSRTCRYDYHKTNNQTTAKSTKDAEDDFDDTDKGTIPVSTCGYLTPPDDGGKDGIVYINGSSVTLKCNNGFKLTGSDQRMCIAGAWSGNTTACEKIEDDTTLLIIIIAAAIGGVLVLALCFLCLICLCRKCNRKEKKKHDHEMGSLNSLTHPVHTPIANGHVTAHRDSDTGSYDRPLPMTPDEEHRMPNGYANGDVRNARHISNGHANGNLAHVHVMAESANRSTNGGRDTPDHGIGRDRESMPAGPPPRRPPSTLVLPAAVAASSSSSHNHYGGSSNASLDQHHPSSSHDLHQNLPSSSNHNQSSSSRPTSRIPPGAVAMFPMEGGDMLKKAGLVGPPPKKGPKIRAKENDYDDPIALRRGKTRMPSARGSEIPAYREESDSDESEDEIARIKAQVRAEMES